MHLDPKQIQEFQNGQLNTNDMISFLEHIDSCEHCLRYVLEEEDRVMLPSAPVQLKGQILARVSSVEIQTEKEVRTVSYRARFWRTGIRTAAGVAAALALLFAANAQSGFSLMGPPENYTAEVSAPPETVPERKNSFYDFSMGLSGRISRGSEKITDYINNFSNKLINGGN